MNSKTCEVVIFTQSAALSFEVIVTSNNFEEILAEALEEGTVVLDTVDGSKLILNAINVAAIEVHKTTSVNKN